MSPPDQPRKGLRDKTKGFFRRMVKSRDSSVDARRQLHEDAAPQEGIIADPSPDNNAPNERISNANPPTAVGAREAEKDETAPKSSPKTDGAVRLDLPTNDESVKVKGHEIPPLNTKDATPGLWNKAFEQLSDNEKQKLVNSSLPTVDIEYLRNLVLEKKEKCEKNAWRFKFAGKEIILREQAETIINWLVRFKEVGDVAVQYDPVHAALPWAGVRFLLEAATAEQNQMGALLTGVEIVSGIITRCLVYERLYLYGANDISEDRGAKNAKDHLESALEKMYIEVLRFLANAITTYEKSFGGRTLEGILEPGKLKDKIDYLQGLSSDVSKAVDTCMAVCMELTSVELKKLSSMLNEFERPILRIDENIRALCKVSEDEKRLQILRWISPLHYEDYHKVAHSGYTGNTGLWLLENSNYKKWRDSSASMVLWLHGIPGAGKTKLTSLVVHNLREELGGREGFAYFYFDRNQTERNSAEAAMRSFVRQLSTFREGLIPREILDYYGKMERNGFPSNGPTFDECRTLMLKLLEQRRQVTLIIDALDECSSVTRADFIETLDGFVRDSKTLVKIFISSRPDADIVHRFNQGPNIGITAKDNSNDIEKFVQSKIESSPPLWLVRVRKCEGLEQEIIKTLNDKAGGMFQWAKLQIDHLLKVSTPKDIRGRLGRLPKDLQSAYDEIFQRINDQEGSGPGIAYRAFHWVMASMEPMNPEMLLKAVCYDPETKSIYTPDFNFDFVLESCQNLLIVDESGKCRFSHLSVQEYFEKKYAGESAKFSHAEITVTSLSYLTYASGQDALSREGVDLPSVIEYAGENWIGHAKHCESMEDVQRIIQSFLWNYQAFESFTRMFAKGPFTPLEYASFEGLENTVSSLLKSNRYKNAKREEYSGALQLSTYKNHKRISMLLIEKGADINATEDKNLAWKMRPLSIAIENGDVEMVEFLVSNGAEKNYHYRIDVSEAI